MVQELEAGRDRWSGECEEGEGWVPQGGSQVRSCSVSFVLLSLVLADTLFCRPSVRANRAGTRGFRAPEVLLKCPDQTVCASPPFVPDRPEANARRRRSARHLVRRDHASLLPHPSVPLLQLERRHGSSHRNRRHLWSQEDRALCRWPQYVPSLSSSSIHELTSDADRSFITSIPTLETPPHPNLHALVKSLNPTLFVENSPNPCGKIPSTSEEDDAWYSESELFLVVDLMKRCLELDGTRRCEWSPLPSTLEERS